MDHICTSSQSFTQKFNYSLTRGRLDEAFVEEVEYLINEQLNNSKENNETTGGQNDVRNFLRAVSFKSNTSILLKFSNFSFMKYWAFKIIKGLPKLCRNDSTLYLER